MSALAHVLGLLGKPAEFRVSKNGSRFATFVIRENVAGKTRWWRVIAFDEDVLDSLGEMEPGSSISVVGDIDADIWSPPNGEARINWRLTCNVLLPAKAKRRPRAQKLPASADRRSGRLIAASSWAAPPEMGGGNDVAEIRS